jgi:pyridoxal phosphate enzyme (YggS family)
MSLSAATHDVVAALKSLQSSIQSISTQYNRAVPRLVAVSKTKPNSLIQQAYQAGQRHFGENYVRELIEKQPQLPADINWHFIGHLQSNKAKALLKAVNNLYIVESVDSVKLANELNKACSERSNRLKVLVQVNTSQEASKSGCEPSEAVNLYGHILMNCPRLEVCGLMTIGRLASTPQPDCFELLKQCKAEILEAYKDKISAEKFELSMGMSGDYESAIQHGSTNVRIGSTIFGARDYSKELKDYTKEESKDESPKNASRN